MNEELVGKTRLAKAFFSLFDKMPYEKITVSAICKEAAVSRQTFYRHFENKDDIAKWYFYEAASQDMYLVGRGLSWNESIRAVALHAKEAKRYLGKLFRGDNYDSIKMYAYRSRVDSLQETVRILNGGAVSDLLAFQIEFFARAEVELITSYSTDTTKSVEQYVRYMESCVPRELHDLLDPKK